MAATSKNGMDHIDAGLEWLPVLGLQGPNHRVTPSRRPHSQDDCTGAEQKIQQVLLSRQTSLLIITIYMLYGAFVPGQCWGKTYGHRTELLQAHSGQLP